MAKEGGGQRELPAQDACEDREDGQSDDDLDRDQVQPSYSVSSGFMQTTYQCTRGASKDGKHIFSLAYWSQVIL